MSFEPCQHPNRVNGRVRLDFARQDAAEGPVYSGTVSVAICEDCGYIELHAEFQHLLCDWLRRA